jgi:hypothetical protein
MSETSEISSSEMSRYRELIATVCLKDNQRDEVIQIVRSIMQAFVDLTFQVHSAQLSTKSTDKDSSQKEFSRATLVNNQKLKSAFAAQSRQQADSENVKGVPYDATSATEGSHLLPR